MDSPFYFWSGGAEPLSNFSQMSNVWETFWKILSNFGEKFEQLVAPTSWLRAVPHFSQGSSGRARAKRVEITSRSFFSLPRVASSRGRRGREREVISTLSPPQRPMGRSRARPLDHWEKWGTARTLPTRRPRAAGGVVVRAEIFPEVYKRIVNPRISAPSRISASPMGQNFK